MGKVVVRIGTDNDFAADCRSGCRKNFLAGYDISTNPDFTFIADGLLTQDTRYQNQYGVGDPCNAIPLPGTWPLLAVGLILLARVRRQVGGR
jgi:hypothetical protein